MLSRNDIEKELGKQINIFPFYADNLKENSVNFTVSEYSWTLGEGSIIKNDGRYRLVAEDELENSGIIQLKKGQSAIIDEGDVKYLVLLPHETTIVESEEVLSVGNNIGGTFHSKVSVVDQGIGDIGTMLGPCFSGHLMFSLHNMTNDVKILKVGETFVSLVFYYLKTSGDVVKNSHVSGHVDKLAELGIQITMETRAFLNEGWKQNIEQVGYKMTTSKEYIDYMEMRKAGKKSKFMQWLSLRNILFLVLFVIVILSLGYIAYRIDSKNGTNVWEDRFWTIVGASVFAQLAALYFKIFKKK